MNEGSPVALTVTATSRQRSNSVTFRAKRTFSEPRLMNYIYECAP